jgi:membrane-associated protease RseP (regulator of RpoE activity)
MKIPGGMKKFPLLHLVLFLLTVLTTLVVGALTSGADIFSEPYKIYKGIPFAFSLMVILLSHEFSHYFASKNHGVKATLPYFIPAPPILSPIGTFGAFIKMKSPIITRKALIDIGASGPIAGFIFSVIAAVIGLNMSRIVSLTNAGSGPVMGDSLLFSFLSRSILGIVPAGYDVLLHPVAFAGWIGLFVTSMNLIPVGQLDGGHIAYALLGEKQTRLSFALVVFMLVLGFLLWEGWFVWAVLLLVLGLRHPPVVYWEVPLDRKRKVVGWIALLIFILTFIPVPFKML